MANSQVSLLHQLFTRWAHPNHPPRGLCLSHSPKPNVPILTSPLPRSHCEFLPWSFPYIGDSTPVAKYPQHSYLPLPVTSASGVPAQPLSGVPWVSQLWASCAGCGKSVCSLLSISLQAPGNGSQCCRDPSPSFLLADRLAPLGSWAFVFSMSRHRQTELLLSVEQMKV